MTKTVEPKKITAPTPTPNRLRSPVEAVNGFFRVTIKAAGLSYKEGAAVARVNDTTFEGWMNGTRPDPFTRAQDMFAAVTRRNKGLGPNILAYIAGGADFDGGILTAEEWHAAMIVARAVLKNRGE